jgi:plastocyanin
MGADPYCEKANEGGATRTVPRVSADGGLADVLIYIASGLAKTYPVPSEAVSINQVSCNYTPRVLGAMAGQPIEIMNSDDTLHNVHALPENSNAFNLGMPTKGMKSTRKFANPEIFVRIKCDVHPWMETFVGVTDNPFYAVSDDDGSFEIQGVPPGEYTIVAAHPRNGRATATMTVESGEASGVALELGASE